MRPIRHVATQAIDDCNSLLAPFLPHAAQTVHEVFGGQDTISPMPRIEEVTDLDDANSQYPIMTGDYRLPTETDAGTIRPRSEEHTSELQSRGHLVCRLLPEKKKHTTH